MRLRILIAVVALPCALWAVLPVLSSGQTASVSSLRSKIDKKRSQIGQKKRRERVLSVDIQGYSRRIGRVQEDITSLQRRQAVLQADLDAKRNELVRLQEQLRQERARLARLRARLAEGRRVLAKRLVELYKADKPDMVTVVLESEGFNDLLERSEFISRVGQQDNRIIKRVRGARSDAKKTADRLSGLERRQQKVTAIVLDRRNEVAAIKGQLVDRRNGYAVLRGRKERALGSVRHDRLHLEGDLKALEKEEAAIVARLRGVSSGGGGGSQTAGPIRQGSGSLVWPVNGPVVSPFGPRWGRLHAGVDIAVPAGTPIRAADSGKVVLLGWTGGYGNYTCVAHGGGGLSTCYAHQSSYATSNGASVSKGQVIGYVGCTGHCFGDHLHFETRVNGSPVNPMGYL